MDVPQFIHSPTERHLGCFRVMAIMNKGAGFCVDMCFQLIWVNNKECHLLDSMVKLFNFIRNYQTFPKWLYHFAFATMMDESSCCSTSSPTFGVAGVLDFSHCIRYVVVSRYCFNLHFPNDIRC